MPLTLHHDDPDYFYQTIGYTAQTSGFDPRLIEKDYFCSVLLECLAAHDTGLVFKGGTCLAKVHDRFYRLSEDLDFTISTDLGSTRQQRRLAAGPVKALVERLPDLVTGFRVREAFTGANESTQYNGALEYQSALDGHWEPVRIEVSLSEENLLPTERGEAATALLNPISGSPLVPRFPVASLSYRETMAEKFRASLCRVEVAIRDFFDVDHAVQGSRFDPLEPAFLDLLRRKLAAPRTGPVDVSDRRVEELQRQLEGQLRPMLRAGDYSTFSLERAVTTVRAVAAALGYREGRSAGSSS